VALPAPVMRIFDYLPPENQALQPQAGQRVRVPFGKSTRVGVLIGLHNHSDVPPRQLRNVLTILDVEPVLDAHVLKLAKWACRYYHHPPGEVFAATLPKLLRRGGTLIRGNSLWELTDAGRDKTPDSLRKRAPLQAQILQIARDTSGVLSTRELESLSGDWRRSLAALVEKKYLDEKNSGHAFDFVPVGRKGASPVLNDSQRLAIETIGAFEDFRAYLLDGVTGSGKTEVYLRCIESALEKNRQSLVLVPEIGLTPQLLDRFRRRLDVAIGALHSGLSDTDRLRNWCASRDGSASVIIGTRSAVFTPLARPGLIIVDEEHDASLKQQDGFRYSARDLAVWRARELNIPVILGSATPSFESLENVSTERYRLLSLPERAGGAKQPDVHVIDLRIHDPSDGLSQPLIQAIRRHLDANGQILLYLNRRGFAPVLMCPGCGNITECRRCDARMVVHQGRSRLVCHHCGAEQGLPSACPDCEGTLRTVGQGTERIEQALGRLFPEQPVVRIDRDTTRRRGEIERRLDMIRGGEARLLLGTQMLTKGHDFPGVTMVGIIDADQGLFGTDFRSSERLAQTFIQVAGRAGRADRPGEVFIQTWFPDHPLLQILVRDGYGQFAQQAMEERRVAGWPPFTHLALLRAESAQRDNAFTFLDEARVVADELATENLRILGPAPAPMERRSGRYRAQLLIQGNDRAAVHRFLKTWRVRLDALKSSRRTRWSLDIDPAELF
jgi:primosomal protein N' (replication factor Y)